MKYQIHFSALLAATLLLSGCETTAPSPPVYTTISAQVPVITAMPETSEAQRKGGLEITIVPARYHLEKRDVTTIEPITPGLGRTLQESLAIGDGKPRSAVRVQEETETILAPTPERLQFVVRLNNQLSRVFRGQGAVIQFNVDGQLIPFGHVDYTNFLNGVVPPRNESSFVIFGPRLRELPDSGAIGLYIYDVVTETDAAGNVTERQNFEWFFQIENKIIREQVKVRKRQYLLDLTTYHQRMDEQAHRMLLRR